MKPLLPPNIVFHGNSYIYGHGASRQTNTIPYRVAASSFLAGTGATVRPLGVNGQTWRQMDGLDGGDSSKVDGAYIQGKVNILVAWETINSGNRTVLQNVADARSYIANRLALHPDWRIVLVTSLPVESWRGERETLALNARLQAVDDIFRASYRDMGAEALIDVRAPGSPWRYSGFTPADFDATQELWYTADGARVHPNDAGYALITEWVIQALERLIPRS